LDGLIGRSVRVGLVGVSLKNHLALPVIFS
jgi:hypothetical protein